MSVFLQGLRLFVWMTVLTGFVYPVIITLIAQLAFTEMATGSLVVSQGHVVGSKLIAQKFTGNQYFWPRPSAVDYNPLPSGGSNLGPTSALLKKQVGDRRKQIAQAHGIGKPEAVPPQLIFASGSGLDPHISVEAAYFQIDRVAKARGMDTDEGKAKIKQMINSMIHRQHSHYINVLLLNIALDELKVKTS